MTTRPPTPAVPAPRREDLAESVFVLHDVLSAQECVRLIAWSEASGYKDAPVTSHDGPAHRPDIRNNHRVMSDDPMAARRLWSRVAPFIHRRPGWTPVGLNERLRFYRYKQGQRFALHRDGHYARSSTERSFLTLLFYLNDDFQGGETRFVTPAALTPPSPQRDRAGGACALLTVKPIRGMALLFEHSLLHEGAAVVLGQKYVLRSDVMFHR